MTINDVPETALNALIDATMAHNLWDDYQEIVRRAEARGEKFDKRDLSDLRHQNRRTLVPAKVKSLAVGMGLPPYVVAVALLADLGIEVPLDVRGPEDAVAHDHTLSVKARKFLLAIMEADRED